MKKILSLLGHQKWLRFGLRDRIIRFFHNPDTCASEVFEVSFFGSIYQGDFNTFIDWSTYYYGAYSESELICMKEILFSVKESVVLDIGANIGHHSLYASSVASVVHAFEPYEPVFQKLKEKIIRNNLKNLYLHEVGVGDSNEIKIFYPPAGHNTGTGSFVSKEETNECVELKIVRLDDYIKKLKLDKIDFIKMDIEGYEVNALKGMQLTLSLYRPFFFFEWSQNHICSDVESSRDLFPDEYTFYLFVPRTAKFIFFQVGNYALKELVGPWEDGNILAVPNEKRKQLSRLEN